MENCDVGQDARPARRHGRSQDSDLSHAARYEPGRPRGKDRRRFPAGTEIRKGDQPGRRQPAIADRGCIGHLDRRSLRVPGRQAGLPEIAVSAAWGSDRVAGSCGLFANQRSAHTACLRQLDRIRRRHAAGGDIVLEILLNAASSRRQAARAPAKTHRDESRCGNPDASMISRPRTRDGSVIRRHRWLAFPAAAALR